MIASPGRPWRTVVDVLLGVALVVVAVELWRRGGMSGRGLTRIDGRWWAGAVGVATLAGILFLNATRRCVIAVRTCLTPADRKVVPRGSALATPPCQDRR
ncbi:MAG: hypothetical protein M3308_09815 [Actinomycetota bacterium]|nr:hypothetical protein [Actinomycetota bacterium]